MLLYWKYRKGMHCSMVVLTKEDMLIEKFYKECNPCTFHCGMWGETAEPEQAAY